VGYHDPAEFWSAYHRAKAAMAAIDALAAPARRRARAALVRLLRRHRSDLMDRLGRSEEGLLVEEAYLGYRQAERRCSGDTKDAKTDQAALETLLIAFLGRFRARQLDRESTRRLGSATGGR
jgi:hypothetical protein